MTDSQSPSCFISYSWEDEEHKAWVRMLTAQLRLHGVDAHLDQFELAPGADLTQFMESRIRESRFVLLVCTPVFASKTNSGVGGVGYEKQIVTGEIFNGNVRDTKFVPLLRRGSPAEALPSYLQSRLFIDFRDGDRFTERLEELLRHLHGAPMYVAPELGPKPDFSQATLDRAHEPSTMGADRPLPWISLEPRYFEGFDFAEADPEQMRQRLSGAWLDQSPEPDPVWSTFVQDGLYWLVNRTEPLAVHYRHLGLSDSGNVVELGTSPVSVEVVVRPIEGQQPNALTAAGLLYRFDQSSRDYYAFMVYADGRYSFGRRTSRGYATDFIERSDRLRPGTANKLGILGDGPSIHLYINDRVVKIIRRLERSAGKTGVIAASVGQFGFDNFAIYRTG